ncbi:quinone oxidoreductase [Anaerobacillus arseniciselenatis]|uniref:Quinone oxidoreductase n=1 Tax=Anaerobacillus arseniciselenatis TaxID=85682 RepID=A0A1S2LP78_9BACI|nr:NADPH:quinone reductase [Anaerobacillus arseniciselenatis]OIJ14000.1 quinone oxidoreductase [Anaerobacillus arseniciselenatis]
MKAVVYYEHGKPEVLQTVELQKPSIGANEILIKVEASGINPVDTYFRSGVRPVEKFPHIPHFDLGGIVVEVGSNVTKWKVGDRVWGTNIKGTAAQFVAVGEEDVFPLAPHVSTAEGAALSMAFMTAHLALFYRAKLEKGEKVLIFGGAGAVGHAAIQLAKSVGAYTIATAGNEEKATLAKQAGADEVILYQQENVVEKVNALTNGTGVDVIMDVSLSENIEQDFQMIANGGRIITVGSPKNNTPELPWRLLNMKNASLVGVLLFTVPLQKQIEAGKEISRLFAEKKLTALVGKTFTCEQAAKAHEALEAHEFNGSIVITFD